MKHLLYLPKDYNSNRDKKYPLLLFLHGAGESGNNLDKLKKQGPPKMVEAGHDFDFIILSPQSPFVFRPWDVEELHGLLMQTVEKYRIDKNRLYLTGISRGGYGTWKMAIEYPDLFAAIIPICGGGDISEVHKINEVPTWIFHGAKDEMVPLSESQRIADALIAAGGNVTFTIYPDAEHDAWTATYNNPEVFEWMLNQKKAQ